MEKEPIRKSPPGDTPSRLQKPSPIRREWQKFSKQLALVVADLDEDEYLIISEKERNVFVQFAAHGFSRMRVEAASPAFFGSEVKFSEEEKKNLRAMGWRKPTYAWKPDVDEPPDGSCNYYIDVASPSYADLAELAVRTLRDVYHTRHPYSLQYNAFGKEGYQIRFPTLGLKRESGC